MIVRRAETADVERILRFYHDLIDRMRGSAYRPTWEQGVYPTRALLRSAAEAETLYLAEENGNVLGALVLNHAQAEGYDRMAWQVDAPAERVAVLHLLGVHPEVHGRGVGRALLQKAEAVSRDAGDAAIRLDTLPHNLPARRLYEGFGFRYYGETTLTDPAAGTIPFSLYEYAL